MPIKQLGKDEAKKIAKSKIWEKWSDEEIVRFQLFQNRLCMNFSRFHAAVEKVLNRPVFTHEFAFKNDLIKEYLGKKQPPTFEEIVGLLDKED